MRSNPIIISACVCLILFTTQCLSEDKPSRQVSPEVSRALKSVVQGSEKLGLEIFSKASAFFKNVETNKGDFMISPFSIWSLLLMMVEGATGNTLVELFQTLHINENVTSMRTAYAILNKFLTDRQGTSQMAKIQALFSNINRPLELEYEEMVKQNYDTSLIYMNFRNSKQSIATINDFVNSESNGVLNQLLYEQDLRKAQMVLASGVAFKGLWAIPFNVSATREENFYGEDGKVVGRCNMMFQRGFFSFGFTQRLGSYVLELPYGVEDRLSMIILMPQAEVRLHNVIENLASIGINHIFKVLNVAKYFSDINGESEVFVHLPRFQTDTNFILDALLKKIGIRNIYSAKDATLGRMSSSPLHLSKFYHKTIIEVSEEGVVASATPNKPFLRRPTEHKINRPFAYVIVEKQTKTVLYAGQVKNPGIF